MEFLGSLLKRFYFICLFDFDFGRGIKILSNLGLVFWYLLLYKCFAGSAKNGILFIIETSLVVEIITFYAYIKLINF